MGQLAADLKKKAAGASDSPAPLSDDAKRKRLADIEGLTVKLAKLQDRHQKGLAGSAPDEGDVIASQTPPVLDGLEAS